MSIRLFALLVLVPALCVGFAWADEKADDKSSVKKAPEFVLKDSSGKTHKLSEYKNKIVVLEWINYECPYVLRHCEKGTMTKTAKEFSERGVVWLAIDSHQQHDAAGVEKFRQKNQVTYPVLLDTDGKIGRKYGAKTTPHMFIIKEGVILYDGAIDDDKRGKKKQATNHVAAALKEVLAGEPVTVAATQSYGCSVKYAKFTPEG
ncbi:MAG: redoxin domain-containing protein [Planctomycetota bacterium]